jgi:hypothetical protein
MCRRAYDDQLVLDPRLSSDPTFVAGPLDETDVDIEPSDRCAYILGIADLHVDMWIKPLLLGAVLFLWLIGGGLLINTLVARVFN